MSETPTDLVLTERPADGVALVRLNRPEALNALSLPLRQQLAATFEGLQDDAAVRCIVITGNARAFAAGADLKAMADMEMADLIMRRTERYWATIAATPQPVIAAVNGYALGGGLELAMMCDIIIAGEGAELGQPEIRVGILPGAGGTQRLVRAIGKYQAMKLCLTGKPIKGPDALSMGLVSECVADGEVLPTALKMAESIARLPPLAARAVKECIIQGASASLEAGLALERKSLHSLFATEDKREGMAAFIDKRRPDFQGR